MTIKAGKYLARAVKESAHWEESTKKGTKGIMSDFRTLPDDKGYLGGEVAPWKGYLGPKSTERVIESLQYCGCTFPNDNIFDLTGIDTNIVQIVVEIDGHYGPRVAWVNDPSKAPGKPLDGSAADAFALQMRDAIRAKKMAANPSAPTDDDIPDFGLPT